MLRTIVTLIVGGLITIAIFTASPGLNEQATTGAQGLFDSAQGWAAQN